MPYNRFSKKAQLKKFGKVELGTKIQKVTYVKAKKKQYRTLPSLIGSADRKFAFRVKEKYRIGDYCKCFTCDKVLYAIRNKNLHCGHFISRSVIEIRWDFDNARPQCMQCNTFGEGMRHVYEPRLRKEIGDERVDELKYIGSISPRIINVRAFVEEKLKELKSLRPPTERKKKQ